MLYSAMFILNLPLSRGDGDKRLEQKEVKRELNPEQEKNNNY